MNHRSYALGVHIPFFVFPTFLEQTYHIGHIFSLDFGHAAKPCLTDTVRFVGKFHLIVETDSLRTFGKRYAHSQFAHRIGRIGNRFGHAAQKNRTGCQHFYIHNSHDFHFLYMSLQAGTITVSPFLPINRSIRLGDSANLGHHIRRCPRRTSLIRISLVLVPHRVRTDFVQLFGISTDNAALLNVADYPLIEITKLNQFRLGHALHHGPYSQQP